MALLSTTEPSFIEIGATTRAASRRGANYVWNDPWANLAILNEQHIPLSVGFIVNIDEQLITCPFQ